MLGRRIFDRMLCKELREIISYHVKMAGVQLMNLNQFYRAINYGYIT